jgi:hypothetical protein
MLHSGMRPSNQQLVPARRGSTICKSMRGATSNCVDDNSRFVPWRNANLYSAGNPPVITIVLSAVLFCGGTKLSRNFAGRRAFSIKISKVSEYSRMDPISLPR